MIVDLRSDTVTKPTHAMREYMLTAEVGDDVFGEDPTIHRLEERIKNYFGTEAALFVPTATMANQIAIKILTQPMDEVICDRISHVYVYEVGGIAFHSGCSIRYMNGMRGVFTAADILRNINPADVHKTITSLVCLENTVNRGGGKIYPMDEMKSIHSVCADKGLKLHLDGSRLFNALTESGDDPKAYGQLFDTLSVCLSKGLGCPVGALLTGKKELIEKAVRVRKAFGGGMRQAGILAAAGLYAVDNNIRRLKDDHQLAKQLETILHQMPYVTDIFSAETNIVIFRLDEKIIDDDFIHYLAQHDIKAFTIGDNYIRFVTHLDVTQEMIPYTERILKAFRG